MATLIPSTRTCVSRITVGERRLAERLEQKLDDDYLLWYDVQVRPTYSHLDFVVMPLCRDVLVRQIKDRRLSKIQHPDKQNWEITHDGIAKGVISLLEQDVSCRGSSTAQ